MKFRTLGNASVSLVGQGSWNIERDDRSQAVRALQCGLDLGRITSIPQRCSSSNSRRHFLSAGDSQGSRPY